MCWVSEICVCMGVHMLHVILVKVGIQKGEPYGVLDTRQKKPYPGAEGNGGVNVPCPSSCQ